MEQTVRRDRNRVRTVVGVSMLVVALAGCGGSGPATEVTGKVTMNGVPLPGGKVTFIYPDAKMPPATTLIQEGGQYTLAFPPEGDVKIAVEGQGRPSVVRKEDPPPVAVPVKYSKAETSGLTYKVVKGKQTKDLELISP